MEDWQSEKSITRTRDCNIASLVDKSDTVKDTVGMCRPGLGVRDRGHEAGGSVAWQKQAHCPFIPNAKVSDLDAWCALVDFEINQACMIEKEEGSSVFLKKNTTGEERKAGLGRG